MPVRDRPIKYDGPNYPKNPDLKRYKAPMEFPPLYNTDDVEKRTVEPQQSATDGKDTRRTPFRELEQEVGGVCNNCGWGQENLKEIAHYCEDCGTVMPGHTLEENVGNRHETIGEEFGQDAAFPDSDKNGAMHTLINTENNVRTSQLNKQPWEMTKDEFVERIDTNNGTTLYPVGTWRMGGEGYIDVLKKIPISEISYQLGNTINTEQVNEYRKNYSISRPIVFLEKDGSYTVDDGHHRIEADKENGHQSSLVWVSDATDYPRSRTYRWTIKKAIEAGEDVPEEIKAEHEHRTGQAFNSGQTDDWQKPKLNDLDPYKLFERNLVNRIERNPNPDGTAPLEGAGYGLLYGNPRKDKVWVGNNPSEITDRSEYLREHVENLNG